MVIARAGPCGRRCRACGTFPSSYRSSAHLPATMASSDSSLRFRAPACAPFGFGLRRRFPSSSALRCIPARPPKFLTELSRRVVLLCPARALAVGFAVASGDLPSGLRPSAHAPARPKPIRALGVGFTASELLAARNSNNETLRRRFICIATHLFVRQDSRIRVAPLTACSALRAIPSLRSALTAFGGYVLIISRFVCDSYSFHHDRSAKLVLAYLTLFTRR